MRQLPLERRCICEIPFLLLRRCQGGQDQRTASLKAAGIDLLRNAKRKHLSSSLSLSLKRDPSPWHRHSYPIFMSLSRVSFFVLLQASSSIWRARSPKSSSLACQCLMELHSIQVCFRFSSEANGRNICLDLKRVQGPFDSQS